MINNIKLPKVNKDIAKEKITLPYNGSAVSKKSFSFSFSCFDRTHKLFNLGDNTPEKVVSGKWFLDLFECLKSVNKKTITELESSMYDLHPVNWSTANASIPPNSEQCEFWQFRINKSKGRVIGILIDGVFYVVWLDAHHNLTNSDGYGGINYFKKPISEYEKMQNEIIELKEQNKQLQEDIKIYKELFDKI